MSDIEQKKKMPDDVKAKLIYAIELAIFTVVFLVLGILILVHVITPSENIRHIFNYVTLAGGVLIIADFFWALLSPKRRAKVSLLDKFLTLPVAGFLMGFDVFCIVMRVSSGDYPGAETYQLFMGIAFLYIAADYCFQAIYHWFYPIPGLLDVVAASAEENSESTGTAENVEEAQENPNDEDQQ